MDTQNTLVHVRLWHREFWLIAIANLLLTMTVYILIPVMPSWLMTEENFSIWETGLAMGAFGGGLFLFGSICSYLVQRFRRNIVCMWAIIAVVGCIGGLYYVNSLKCEFVEFWVILIQRIILGGVFGLAQMVLGSTLIIDTSESFQRTEANYSAAWFSRFALSLGPMTGLIVNALWGFDMVIAISAVCGIGAVVLIKLVDFPFRAPDENVKVFSLDRFFLPNGVLLFVNLLLIAFVIGIVLTIELTHMFYGMLMSGFFVALLAERYVFMNAELKSEVITGLILIFTALLLMLTRKQMIVSYISPLFIGVGTGLICSRFLLFFIKLSRHCQRGTSQSMYMLGWESGLALGIGTGYILSYFHIHTVLLIAMSIVVTALIMYNVVTHEWYVRNKNR